MPPIPHTSPSTNLPTPPSYIHTTSFSFVDTHGRTLLLRGVNLSGASKAPVGRLSHVLDGFWESAGAPPDDEEGEFWDEGDDASVMSGSSCSSSDSSESGRSRASSPGASGSGQNTTNPKPKTRKQKQKLSFVNRPLNIDDGTADVHLARLRGWGFNLLRFPFTWEALEHEGPGKYDYEYMDYLVKCLVKCKEYGFRVYMDPHQDTWSRFSGGSGAPYWTLPACGINPRHISATQAALLHCEYPTPYRSSTPQNGDDPSSPSSSASASQTGNDSPNDPDTQPQGPDPASLPAMSWATNYGRLLSQTLFTLFFAGKDFAPKCVIDGVNIQEYLQSHFIAACAALVKRIAAYDDALLAAGVIARGEGLLDACVIGWDSLNEPFEGLVGWADIQANPGEQGSTLKKGTYPTPAQSMRLGMGMRERVEHWSFSAMGPKKDGWVDVDPKGRRVWADAVAGADAVSDAVGSGEDEAGLVNGELPDGTHPIYGWKRDVSQWTLGTCIWAQHGVWDVPTGYVLRPDYFLCNPRTSLEVEFLADYWKPHFLAFSKAIREFHPEAIIFVQPPVFAIPPRFTEEELRGRAAYSPHYYDGLTLVTRHWHWFNADALGLLRGKYKTSLGAVKIGEGAIRRSLHEQLGYLKGDVAAPPRDNKAGEGNAAEDGEEDGEEDWTGPGGALGGRNTRGYPTVIGEIGTPFDMDGKKSYGWTDGGKYKGDYTNQEKALDASLQACDAWVDKEEKAEWERERKERERDKKGGGGGERKKGELSNRTLKGDSLNWTVWTYVPDDHSHAWGDGWNMEDLSLWSGDDLVREDEDGDEGECCDECCPDAYAEEEEEEEEVDVGKLGLGEGVYREMRDLHSERSLVHSRSGVHGEEEALHSRAGLLMDGEREGDGDGNGNGVVKMKMKERVCRSRFCRFGSAQEHVHRRRHHHRHKEAKDTKETPSSKPKSKDAKSKSKDKAKAKANVKASAKLAKTQQQPGRSLPMTAALSSLSIATLGSSTSLGVGVAGVGIGAGAGGHRRRKPINDTRNRSAVSVSSGTSTSTSSTRNGSLHHHHHHHHHPKSLHAPQTQSNPIPPALLKAGYHPNPYTFLTNGARAVRAFARPFPVAVIGRAVDVRFDVAKSVFKLVVWVGWEDAFVRREDVRREEGEEEVATEVYIPLVHYAHPRLLEDGFGVESVGVEKKHEHGEHEEVTKDTRSKGGYPPSPAPALHLPVLTRGSESDTTTTTTVMNKDSLESSIATLAPPAHLTHLTPNTPDLSTLTMNTPLMASSPPSPSPLFHAPNTLKGVPASSNVSPTSPTATSTPTTSTTTTYPPHTNTPAPLLIRSPFSPSSQNQLVDIEVTLSPGTSYSIKGQTLLWHYPVPREGEGRREYVLEVRRRGGPVVVKPKAKPKPKAKSERDGNGKDRRGRGEDGQEEEESGCCESLCDEQGCVIA